MGLLIIGFISQVFTSDLAKGEELNVNLIIDADIATLGKMYG